MIPAEFIDKLRQATDIVEVIAQWVPLKKAGTNHKGLCPFHNEKTPSFTVNAQKQMYHCFGCGEGGDVIKFLMQSRKMAFVDAVKFLAERCGMEIPDDGVNKEVAVRQAKEMEVLRELLALTADWFERNLNSGSEAVPALKYAQDRGLTDETRERFKLGWAPLDGNLLIKKALAKGYNHDQLIAAGLVQRGDRGIYSYFRGRLIYPIWDTKALIAGFGGRLIKSGEPKYLNSPDTLLFFKRIVAVCVESGPGKCFKKKAGGNLRRLYGRAGLPSGRHK
jgi:DNA primase